MFTERMPLKLDVYTERMLLNLNVYREDAPKTRR